ncbi:MAG: hypothetical protein U5N21_09390 [Rhodococcus sp. (in: high G+C Gram-positive bacteria)]|nr:hypothetical protein [Rhodococcus sp. (in: high G+C Gram-positive bacteria)]
MTVLAILLSGVLAGLLSDPDGVDIFDSPGIDGVLLSGGGGGVAIAVLMAVAIAMTLRRRVVLVGLTTVAAVVAGASALVMPSDAVSVLAGGVLLGCTAVQATRRIQQAVLIASFFGGLLCAGAVAALEYENVPRRYADYLTEAELGTPIIVPVLSALVVVATVLAARYPGGETPPRAADFRTAVAGLLVPLSGLLLGMLFVHNLFQGSSGFEQRWYLGILVVPVLFVSAALLPGRGGMPVLAGTAVLLTSTTTVGAAIDVGDRVWVLGLVAVTAAAVAAGMALGLRWGRAWIGIVTLASVCVTALFASPPLDNVHYVASLVIFPAASAYLYVSCLSGAPTATTLGLAVPVAITVPMVITYGWTAYTPLTSIDTSTLSPSSDSVVSTGGAFATVVLAGLGMALLLRRLQGLASEE